MFADVNRMDPGGLGNRKLRRIVAAYLLQYGEAIVRGKVLARPVSRRRTSDNPFSGAVNSVHIIADNSDDLGEICHKRKLA